MHLDTGSVQTWIVPVGVTEATFRVSGASGGGTVSANGGKAQDLIATVPVTPGSVITLMVGGKGEDGGRCDNEQPRGGFNGGGNGGAGLGVFNCAGAGGGGASDVRIGGSDLSHRVLVAAGGGGAGTISASQGDPAGGNGGELVGEDGHPYTAGTEPYRGHGGDQDCTSGSGQSGVGSTGANNGIHGSGGGGGGWCGGSGGAIAPDDTLFGGGGGSSYAPANAAFQLSASIGNGFIFVSYHPLTIDATCEQTNDNKMNCTFPFTGTVQGWIVPAGVSEATFELSGARGGNTPVASGGAGFFLSATLAVTPGDTITLMVGGHGGDVIDDCDIAAAPGGFNGGGGGGNGQCAGASGGGATDVRIGGTDLSHRVLVAAGGGGAANADDATLGPSSGGRGDRFTGADGGPADPDYPAYQGQGGNQDCTTGSGLPGVGSAGEDAVTVSGNGGGGGGWCGGSGGRLTPSPANRIHGGGGGSSYGPADAISGWSLLADGLITITFDFPNAPICLQSGITVICTAYPINDSQTWTVPAGITEAQFELYGGSGGSTLSPGGLGGQARAILPLTPGSTITLMVGGQGVNGGACFTQDTPGGFNGGGNGGAGTGVSNCAGAGGGGASDVRIGGNDLAHRVLVAGGGGGAASPAFDDSGSASGGNGGGIIGGDGLSFAGVEEYRGHGGDQECTVGSGHPGNGSGGATNGSHGSGGGGGGWCGGSGGSVTPDLFTFGGGGGSGYGPADIATLSTGVHEGDGLIVIIYELPDLEPPVTTASYSNSYVPGTWTNQPVMVTLSATDNHTPVDQIITYTGLDNSGCAPAAPASCDTYSGPITISTDGNHTLTFFSVDLAGNVETPQSKSIKIDQTPPTASPSISGTAGTNGWYTSAITINWNWSDSGAGIDPASCISSTSTAIEGQYTLSASCADMVGNSTTASADLKIDLTPPTITYSGNLGTYTVDQQVNITCTAADAVSGIASTTCANIVGPAWTFGAGSRTVSSTATDYAGLSSSASTTFTVDVTYTSLGNLSCQFVGQPTICTLLRYYLDSAQWAEGRHQGIRNALLDLYSTLVTSLRNHGLNAQQVQTLIDLANVTARQ
ncbi:MAG: glycine rich domain-containing protein [Thermomicrobiales bacterium]|nr:glycine rich domain-containing protein [Thermomicrobiales bacterium]